ncbi:MAG TPA: OsmC family protein [Bellilinea sp.]|nr:OsmC family protein [Bellilinea sp.]
MEVKVKWNQKMQFTAVGDSGHEVIMDAKPDVGGEDTGSRPTEVLVMAAGGCTGMDVISILQKMKQNVFAFEVRIHADKATEHPHVITAMELEYVVTGHNIDPGAVDKAAKLSFDKYCGVLNTLKPAVKITYRSTVKETDFSC